MSSLSDLVRRRGVLIADGAMGTELFARGLPAGEAPELWNLENPEAIVAIHNRYIGAGSDIVVTNSFGGTSYRLKLHGMQDRVAEISSAAARNGRMAADAAERSVLVAGSMGPTGELLDPLGTMTFDAATKAFAAQAGGLCDGGADLLWIETMSSLDEVEAAVTGANSVCDLPIVATLSFDTAGRTMMGVTGGEAAQRLNKLGVEAVGVNCGQNLADSEAALVAMRAAAPDGLLVSKANAGIPQWKGAELSYSGSPQVMGAHAARAREAGAQIIGGCCGTSPEHIALMADVLAGRVEAPDIAGPPPSVVVNRARRSGRSSRGAGASAPGLR